MKAMLVPTGAMPKMVEIDGLKDLQRLVGGHIEACGWIFNDEPTVYVNDNGKLELCPNRAVYATAEDEGKVLWSGETVHEGDLLDVMYGDFVCIGFDWGEGEDKDIADAEIEKVMKRFGTEQSIASGWLEVMRVLQQNN